MGEKNWKQHFKASVTAASIDDWDMDEPEPTPKFQYDPAGDGARCWAESDGSFQGITQTHLDLPPGLYRAEYQNNRGAYLQRVNVQLDDLIDLPDSPTMEVIREIDRFWDLRDRFDQRGFLHKRGIVLWGDPGGGKTSCIQQIAHRIVERGGIAVMVQNPKIAVMNLEMLRRIEPDREVVVFMEDLDALIRQHDEEGFLSLLDGENQIAHVVYIATTNYPERLDKRIIDRPSRFDMVVRIPMPSDSDRRMFLQAKEPSLTPEELDEWVAKSDGFSIAHLKEMIVAVRVFDQPINEVITRLEKMMERKTSSDEARETKGKIGFR